MYLARPLSPRVRRSLVGLAVLAGTTGCEQLFSSVKAQGAMTRMPMLADAALAAILFASTDVDDLFILVALLADPRQRATQVVLGQYLGIAALVAASLAAALVALVLPPQYIGLLGLVPVGMGIHGLLELRGQRVQTGSAAPADPGRSALAVAAVTIANGGDNIGVYTPVFAVSTAAQVAVMAAVFALMTAVWLALAPGASVPRPKSNTLPRSSGPTSSNVPRAPRS